MMSGLICFVINMGKNFYTSCFRAICLLCFLAISVTDGASATIHIIMLRRKSFVHASYPTHGTSCVLLQGRGHGTANVKNAIAGVTDSSLRTVYLVICAVHVNIGIIIRSSILAMGTGAGFQLCAPSCSGCGNRGNDGEDANKNQNRTQQFLHNNCPFHARSIPVFKGSENMCAAFERFHSYHTVSISGTKFHIKICLLFLAPFANIPWETQI